MIQMVGGASEGLHVLHRGMDLLSRLGFRRCQETRLDSPVGVVKIAVVQAVAPLGGTVLVFGLRAVVRGGGSVRALAG